MKNKLNKLTKIICYLLIATCYLFTSCPDSDIKDDDGYNNPNAGQSRYLNFSRDSGFYTAALNAEAFKLTLTSVEPWGDIYYTTDGSVPSPSNPNAIKYTAPIPIVNRNSQPRNLSKDANHNEMFMVSGDRGGNATQPNSLTDAQVPKGTVIRAVALDAQGKPGEIITKTYFVDANSNIYGNYRIISLVSDPDGLVSQERGILVKGHSSNRWDGANQYNYRQRGEDWERVAGFQLFETDRKLLLSTNVGIRVRGGWSRGHGQKSFNVYFRSPADFRLREPDSTYSGINNFVRSNYNFDIVPGAVKADGTPVGIVKSFMLRNGANDADYTKFYDVFLQNLLKDESYTTQAGVPCIVFLNGEYWGPYNLQERYSDNHAEYKYGVPRASVISYDNDAIDDGDPAEGPVFESLLEYLADLDMSNSANYAQFTDAFDEDSFIDYWAAQIYIYNEDWPHNNYRVFKTNTVVPNNSYGDGKWRFQMFDVEFALGIYSGGGISGQDAFNKILYGEHSGHRNNKLFAALLANEDFCKKFVNTFLRLYNVNFHPDNFNSELTRYADWYRPAMVGTGNPPSFFTRWGQNSNDFNAREANARTYLTNIRGEISGYLSTYLKVPAGSLRQATLSIAGTSNATITINGMTPAISGSWTGLFNTDGGVEITASAAPSSYEFDGWTVFGGTVTNEKDATTTITGITGDLQITARYKKEGIDVVDVVAITLSPIPPNINVGDSFTLTAAVQPLNATYKTVTWTSSRPNIMEVDNNGKVTIKGGGTASIIVTSTVNNGVSASRPITVEALFKAEPHDEGIRLIVTKNKMSTLDQNLHFRLSGWGNGARAWVDKRRWLEDDNPYPPSIIEIIYPFTTAGKTYSIDVTIDGQVHTITETAGGGVGELSRSGSMNYNTATQTLTIDAQLNSLTPHEKLNKVGWRIIFRKGTNWTDDPSVGEIRNSDTLELYPGGIFGDADAFNGSFTIEQIRDFFPEIYNQLAGGDAFIPFYYDVEYDGFHFDTSEIATTFRVPVLEPFNLPEETPVSSHEAYSSNLDPKFSMLTSSVPYEIVNIPGRGHVMKVSYPSEWTVVMYNLDDYKNKLIGIEFSADVMRAGSTGSAIRWQVPEVDGYPTIGEVFDPEVNKWYTVTGSYDVIPSDNAWFYLTAYEDNNSSSVYYIDNFSLEIK